ncbi:MAG: homoserine dehydrogenase [Peptococcia bacterium]
MEKVDIALLGLGTVGQGVVKILQKNKDQWYHKCDAEINLKKVLEKDFNRERDVVLPEGVMTNNWQEIVSDPDIKVIIEVMGGIHPALEVILEAMENGKSVVTANKDLIAEHGQELFEMAQAKGVDFYFEASVGGGIPIITPLKQSLVANNIQQVMGIINGTTNYILTRMDRDNMKYEDALQQAQELGYAEADPTSDVEGLDAARKIAILASIAFHSRVRLQDVYTEGISKITTNDLRYAKELGYTIKLLGIAREENNEIEVRVNPSMISLNHPLANVNDSYNAIFVRGDAVGDTMFYGQGAGQLPTASSIVGDLVEVIKNLQKGSVGRISCTCYDHKKIKEMGEVETKYYLRMHVVDRPGALASIASVFGNHGVSLATVIQKNEHVGGVAELVVITHQVKERNLQNALKVIKEMSITQAINSLIRVEGIN